MVVMAAADMHALCLSSGVTEDSTMPDTGDGRATVLLYAPPLRVLEKRSY